MNFRKPSKIQEKALPLLLMDPATNMIAQSQSGTGKTAAFSLNILSRIDINKKEPQALALAPSRELARQILGVITHMGQFIEGLTTMAAIPDPSKRGGKYDAHVLVGTPGTVQDQLRRRMINPANIKILVLDEADNMLDQAGLGDQCTRVKAYVPWCTVRIYELTPAVCYQRTSRRFSSPRPFLPPSSTTHNALPPMRTCLHSRTRN